MAHGTTAQLLLGSKSLDNSVFVSSAIDNMLKAGTILRQSTRPFMTCPLGVVEQKGKLHLIWDGRAVNKHLLVPEFHYESLRQVLGWLRPGDARSEVGLSPRGH